MAETNNWKHVMWDIYCIGDIETRMELTRFERPIDDNSLQEIINIWIKNRSMTFDKFYEEYDNVACSDWSKMKSDGNIIYDDSEGDVIRQKNGRELAELPFPPETILYAVEYLCSFRCESVHKIRDWLEWIKKDAKINRDQELLLSVPIKSSELDEAILEEVD